MLEEEGWGRGVTYGYGFLIDWQKNDFVPTLWKLSVGHECVGFTEGIGVSASFRFSEVAPHTHSFPQVDISSENRCKISFLGLQLRFLFHLSDRF